MHQGGTVQSNTSFKKIIGEGNDLMFLFKMMPLLCDRYMYEVDLLCLSQKYSVLS
uniref:Uncharacterized protein n=1 Tax=Anguilla anguilla TaxID=7936 RepID=A0A0E9TCJ5_ANGAN